MGISTNCCMNLPPPSSSSPSRPNPSSLPSNNLGAPSWSGKDRSWRTRGLIGVACLVIGMEVEGFVNSEGILAIADDHGVQFVAGLVNEKGKKWSERGMCPAWRMNSLETVVPENLPRPAARRRWEAVGDMSRIAPAVKVVVRRGGSSCFNM